MRVLYEPRKRTSPLSLSNGIDIKKIREELKNIEEDSPMETRANLNSKEELERIRSEQKKIAKMLDLKISKTLVRIQDVETIDINLNVDDFQGQYNYVLRVRSELNMDISDLKKLLDITKQQERNVYSMLYKYYKEADPKRSKTQKELDMKIESDRLYSTLKEQIKEYENTIELKTNMADIIKTKGFFLQDMLRKRMRENE